MGNNLRPVYMRNGLTCVDMNGTYAYVNLSDVINVGDKMYVNTIVVDISLA